MQVSLRFVGGFYHLPSPRSMLLHAASNPSTMQTASSAPRRSISKLSSATRHPPASSFTLASPRLRPCFHTAPPNLVPINANLDLNYPAGVRAPYFYPNRMIFGFTSGAHGSPTVMPMVGDWTVPPERSASVYDKHREKSSPGYYSVYLDDYQTLAEMTATTWTGIFRFTFPQSNKSHILMDLGRGGGDIEVVDDHTVRGKSRDGHTYFVAEFSRPFAASEPSSRIRPCTPGYSLLGDDEVEPDVRTISGHFAGAYLRLPDDTGRAGPGQDRHRS